MDLDLSVILSWQTIVFCLAIYAIVLVFRTLLELIPKINLKDKLYLKSGILPIIPIITGALLGLIPAVSYMCPGELGAKMINRVLFASVCGLFSGWIFAKVKDFISNMRLSASSVTTGAATPTTATKPADAKTESVLESVMDGAEKSD